MLGNFNVSNVLKRVSLFSLIVLNSVNYIDLLHLHFDYQICCSNLKTRIDTFYHKVVHSILSKVCESELILFTIYDSILLPTTIPSPPH